jgi:hypothetical protein
VDNGNVLAIATRRFTPGAPSWEEIAAAETNENDRRDTHSGQLQNDAVDAELCRCLRRTGGLLPKDAHERADTPLTHRPGAWGVAASYGDEGCQAESYSFLWRRCRRATHLIEAPVARRVSNAVLILGARSEDTIALNRDDTLLAMDEALSQRNEDLARVVGGNSCRPDQPAGGPTLASQNGP